MRGVNKSAETDGPFSSQLDGFGQIHGVAAAGVIFKLFLSGIGRQGGAIVIMDKIQYENEILRQLANQTFYKKT